MPTLIDRLAPHATWKNAALALGVLLVSNLAMGRYILPNIEAKHPEALDDGFLVMTDLEPLRSPEEVHRIFDLYTPDILGSVWLLYALDFVTPLAFAVGLFCLMGKMLRYLEVKAGLWRMVLLLPFAGLLFDYAENVFSLFLIGQYQDGHVLPTLARVAGVATAVKFLCLASTGLALVALLTRTAMRFIARKMGRSR
ncbi:hypothetical protein LBMAG42_54380 [Deltaproteobacteria bacterium]|nr:hypothetical protein LBMAG42_54380 [Deltaproteobacteria bacterium]